MLIKRDWLSLADTWLSGFRYRIPFYSAPFAVYTVSDGGAAQTDIPVPVYFGSSVGDGEKRDTTMDRVFDEIGNDWAKMAITTDDGITQCEISVVDWDAGGQTGIIWFLAPELGKYSSDNSRRLPVKFYLYYDGLAEDNSSYVGEPGDTPSNTVWQDFLWAFMFQETPVDDERTLIDLVGVELDGKWVGTATNKSVDFDTGNVQDGIKRAWDFEAGDTDYVAHGTAGDFYPQDAVTLFYWGDVETRAANTRVMSYSSGGGSDRIWEMGINSSSHWFCEFYNNNAAIVSCTDSSDAIGDSGAEFVMCTYNGGSGLGDAELYRSGGSLIVQDTPTGAAMGNPASTPNAPLIGVRQGGWGYWDGKVAFAAMASIACDKNWMALWNRGLTNTLWVFQQTEEKPTEEYAQRLPITIEPDNFDSDIPAFPLRIFLGTSVGADDQDVSAVFDEVGGLVRKIRITDADNNTLPCEIIYWNDVTEFAVLGVAIYEIDATNGQHIYLYYDAGMPNCGETIVTANTRPTPSSADEFLRFDWHASKYKPNTPTVSPFESAYNTGWVGVDGDQNFESIDDNDLAVDSDFGPYVDLDYGEFITFADNSAFDRTISQPFTLEAFVRFPSEQSNQIRIISKRDASSPFQGYELHFDAGNDDFRVVLDIGASTSRVNTSSTNVDDNNWHHVVATYDGSDTIGGLLMYMDGSADRSVGVDSFPMGGSFANSKELQIGARDDSQIDSMDIQIISARYWATDISADMVKALNQNFRDGLIRFNAVEEKTVLDGLDAVASIEVTPVAPRHIGEETMFVDATVMPIELTMGSHSAFTLAALAFIGSGAGRKPMVSSGDGGVPKAETGSGKKPKIQTGSGGSAGISSATGTVIP